MRLGVRFSPGAPLPCSLFVPEIPIDVRGFGFRFAHGSHSKTFTIVSVTSDRGQHRTSHLREGFRSGVDQIKMACVWNLQQVDGFASFLFLRDIVATEL